MTALKLFADDGELRPPGVADTIQPGDNVIVQCPECGKWSLEYLSFKRAECACGYSWSRSGLLHHTEKLPF
jgi:hypothetical protein